MSNEGFVILPREFRDTFLWKKNRVFSEAEAWLDIVMSVQYSDEQTVYIDRELTTVRRGESVKSIGTWAKRWTWTESKVRRLFDILIKQNMITIGKVHKSTRLRVMNYDTYQGKTTGSRPNSIGVAIGGAIQPKTNQKPTESFACNSNGSSPNRRADDEQTASRRRADDEQTATENKGDKEIKERTEYTYMPISPSAQPASVCMTEHLVNLRSEMSVPPSVRMRERIDGWREDLCLPTVPPVADVSTPPPSGTLPMQMGFGAGESPPESGKDQPPATVVQDMPPERTTKPRKTPKAKTPFIPPSCDEVVAFFVENGYATEVGKQAFLYYHEANWIDSRGNPVKSWKQKMRGVWFKPSNLPQVQSSFPGGVRGIPTIHQAQMMARDRIARASLESDGYKPIPGWLGDESPAKMDSDRYMDMDKDSGRDGDVEIYQLEEMYHENNN